MNPIIIAGLIKRVYPNFNMYSFENRLKLQKFTYFMQYAFELNLGYNFNWYTYGPYSIELTKEAFTVDWKEAEPIKFSDPNSEIKFEKFLNFFKKYHEKKDWLEIASSIHLLKNINKSLSDELIIGIIKNKHKEFENNEMYIKEIFTNLKKEGIIDER